MRGPANRPSATFRQNKGLKGCGQRELTMRIAKAMRGLVVMIALAGMLALSGAAKAHVAIGISGGFAPPAIPVYAQPICPCEGYLWTPGYWAWDDHDGAYYCLPRTC